jgi:AcrR family transcriptional regulator
MAAAIGSKRARTADQKLDRRGAILAAALDALRDTGFDAITMNGLAKRAGLAKGTLYLYFQTKEEVFLALFLEAMDGWCARIAGAFETGMTDAEAIATLARVVREDPLFVDLAARLTSVIERNVDNETLIAGKRRMYGAYGALAGRLEAALSLRPGDGARFALGLVALLLGAAQIDPGSIGDRDDLPDDVRSFAAGSRFDAVFSDGLTLLLRGLRAGDAGGTGGPASGRAVDTIGPSW